MSETPKIGSATSAPVVPERAPVIEKLIDEAKNREVVVYTSQIAIAEVAYGRKQCEPAEEEADFAKIDALWLPPSRIQLAEVSEAIA